MTKKILLQIHNPEKIYNELAIALCPYRERSPGSIIFIVEGSLKNPRIGIRYPGYKLKRRVLKKPNKNSALWANLLDFEVVPFEQKKEGSSVSFTYANLLKDFETYKKDSSIFWDMLSELFERNKITKKPPKLGGINPQQFLEMLKWMWIQEDLNYRLSWEEIGSPIKYRLENKTGSVTSKGAGRSKFYAALILVKEGHFDAATMRRIIP
jgi:hypothetical protein